MSLAQAGLLAYRLTVQVLVVVLLGPQVVLDDEGIGAGEIRHGAGIELAT